MNTDTNLATDEEISSEAIIKTEDFYGKLTKMIFLLLVLVFPWIVMPNSEKPLESFREILVFIVVGFLWLVTVFRFIWRKEFEWRKTRLDWIFIAWIVILGLIFFYSSDYTTAWRGYTGSLTGGLSEYLAYLAMYFLVIQTFNFSEWKKIIILFITSLTLVLVFYMAAAVYYGSNSVLAINFARTPTLVTAVAGILALAFWWTIKRNEAKGKNRSFLLFIILFFIASMLDFHIGWWMWVAGTAILLIFDVSSRVQTYLREKEEIQLGFDKGKKGLIDLFIQGETKYLSLILFFSLSRALSPVFLGEEKLTLLPFRSFLTQYPLLGQRVIFYLALNSLIFCFGLYYYFKVKKDRTDILLVLSGLVSINIAHVLYFSESTILFFLNWILIVYSGLAFLRKAPEKDYIYFLKPGSRGKIIFVVLGSALSIIILGLIALMVV